MYFIYWPSICTENSKVKWSLKSVVLEERNEVCVSVCLCIYPRKISRDQCPSFNSYCISLFDIREVFFFYSLTYTSSRECHSLWIRHRNPSNRLTDVIKLSMKLPFISFLTTLCSLSALPVTSQDYCMGQMRSEKKLFSCLEFAALVLLF